VIGSLFLRLPAAAGGRLKGHSTNSPIHSNPEANTSGRGLRRHRSLHRQIGNASGQQDGQLVGWAGTMARTCFR